MNADFFYIILLCFASGFTLCLLGVYSIQLLRKHRQYQFRRNLAIAYSLAAVGFFNYFIIIACLDKPFSYFINTLLILYDFLVVGGYMYFIVTLVFPNRFGKLYLLLFESPYLVAMVLYAVTKSTKIYPIEVIYTFVLSTYLLVWLLLSIKKHDRMLLDNLGDIEHFDLRWSATLVIFIYVVQLVYEFECIFLPSWDSSDLSNSLLIGDIIWCFVTVIYSSVIYSKVTRQKTFTVQLQEKHTLDDSESQSQSPDNYYKVLTNSDVELKIKEKKYFLDSSLTLQRLATQLGTNRQYLSNYINREKQKTFYEYINDFRLEEAKNLLDGYDERNPQSMESIASLAGFNSYSTFLRSFVKKYDISPSKYLKSKQ